MGSFAAQGFLLPRFQNVRFSIREKRPFVFYQIITVHLEGGEGLDSRIRTLRKARGLSISALSIGANVNASLLSCMERRKVVAGCGRGASARRGVGFLWDTAIGDFRSGWLRGMRLRKKPPRQGRRKE